MGWPAIRLRDVLEQIQRSTPVEADKEYRLLGMRSRVGGPFLRETKKGSEISVSDLNKVETGDFIYSRLFAWQGSFGVIPEELDGSYVSNEFPIFGVDVARLDPRFLAFWFALPHTQKTVEAECFGSTPGTRNRYKEAYFLNLEAPLPPLAEQQGIVAKVDKVAGLVEERRRVLETAGRDAQAMLSSAFREVIDGAPYRPMAEVAPLVRRPVEIEPDRQYTEIGVKSFYNGIFHRRTMNGADYSWQKLFWIKEGDLVFSNLMAWEQGIAVAEFEDNGCVGNHRMLTCQVDRALATPTFLLAYFKTEEGFMQVAGHSPGSIARNKTLSSKKLPTIKVPIPLLDRQRWFDRLWIQVHRMEAIWECASEDVSVLLPALLHRTFYAEEMNEV